MEKKNFVLYLIPARADFALTMTPEEKDIMRQHVAYWAPYVESGLMLVLGPVMDPTGPYGLGIVAVDTEDQLKALMAEDPAVKINRYEYYPMRAVTKK